MTLDPIIPDQSANTNLMLDGQILHGEQAGGAPYLKETMEAVVTNVNRLADNSAVTPGAINVGIKNTAFANFTPSVYENPTGHYDNVAAALEGIDAALATAGGGIKAYQFYDKYLYNAKRNAVHQGVTTGTTVTVAELRAYLGVDAGYQIDSMSATTNWSGFPVASSTVSLYTADYFEGGACLAVAKSASNTSAGLQRTNFSATNLTSKKVRFSVSIPTVSGGGAFSKIRLTLSSDVGFANNAYLDFTTDVGGKTLVAGKYILEMDQTNPAIVDNGIAWNAVVAARIEMYVTNTSATYSNFLVDHLIYTPDTTVLNVNVLVRKFSDGQWYLIKQNADSYSFPNLTAGKMIILNTAIDNATLEDNDVLFIDIPNSSTYGGQDLFVMVKLA